MRWLTFSLALEAASGGWLSERFPATFPVNLANAGLGKLATMNEIGVVERDFCGGPPGIRTLNQWIKSPLLCR